MNAKRQTSLMLATIWVCAVGVPASSADAQEGRFWRLGPNVRVVTRGSTVRITARSGDGGLVKIVTPVKTLRCARDQAIRFVRS